MTVSREELDSFKAQLERATEINKDIEAGCKKWGREEYLHAAWYESADYIAKKYRQEMTKNKVSQENVDHWIKEITDTFRLIVWNFIGGDLTPQELRQEFVNKAMTDARERANQ